MLSMVEYACNPSYAGGGGTSTDVSWGKVSKTLSQKGKTKEEKEGGRRKRETKKCLSLRYKDT
jgi:hypothetical protein